MEESELERYRFGDWKPKAPDLYERSEAGNAVVAFLTGVDDLGLEPDIATAMREMFAAQESFRKKMEQGAKATIAKLQSISVPVLKDMEMPARGAELYKAGVAMGQHEASVVAMDLLMDMISAAWVVE